MKEIIDIISAYREAIGLKLKTALATVIHVDGSSYRRPGARMLVTELGNFTGAISGGCLEGDALRKAQLAIHNGRNKLVTYDTSDEDDVELGIQLGCNGIIHILFEPINPEDTNNPVNLLIQLLEERTEAVIATLFDLQNKSADHPGTCLLLRQNKVISKESSVQNHIYPLLIESAKQTLINRKSVFASLENINAFLEFIPPPTHLIIAGAGNDAIPLTVIAKSVGWKITIIDGRLSHATSSRFPLADEIYVLKPEEIVNKIQLDQYTVCVLMTHNYQYDLACLKLLLHHPVLYIGSLGPKRKLERMLEEIDENPLSLDRVYGPIGLDIGAETAEEIAISIMAEIKAVINGRNGAFLRNKKSGIHDKVNVITPDSAHKTTATCSISQNFPSNE